MFLCLSWNRVILLILAGIVLARSEQLGCVTQASLFARDSHQVRNEGVGWRLRGVHGTRDRHAVGTWGKVEGDDHRPLPPSGRQVVLNVRARPALFLVVLGVGPWVLGCDPCNEIQIIQRNTHRAVFTCPPRVHVGDAPESEGLLGWLRIQA